MKKRMLCLCMALLLVLGSGTAAFAQGAPFAESEYYTQGGYTLHYRQFAASGAAKGRILLLHGFIASTVFWEPLTKRLTAEGYDCVLVDLPGFGYSTRESKAVQAIPREDLLAGLMKQLAPGAQWIIGGHSMGGGVAMNLAAQAPEAVQALLLFAPAASSGGQLAGMLGGGLSEALAWLMDAAFCALLPLCEWKPIARLIVRSQGYAKDYDIKRYSTPLALPHTGGSMVYMMQRSKALDTQGIAALKNPILLLWGSDDMVIGRNMVKQAEACLPAQTKKHTIKGATHVFPEAMAEQTAALVLDFLA